MIKSTTSALQLGAAETQSLDEARARLRAAGHRITQPRIGILTALLRTHTPATMEQIHDSIGRVCDLVTVYRSVSMLVDIGIVRRIFAQNGTTLHELALEPERYHVVTRSGEVLWPIELVPSPEMRLVVQAVEDALRARGYRRVSHVVEFLADASVAGPK